MKHHKTKEEMGNGFLFNEEEHKENYYNSLSKVRPEEKNIMRTYYLIRDWWSDEDLIKLQDFIASTLESRRE